MRDVILVSDSHEVFREGLIGILQSAFGAEHEVLRLIPHMKIPETTVLAVVGLSRRTTPTLAEDLIATGESPLLIVIDDATRSQARQMDSSTRPHGWLHRSAPIETTLAATRACLAGKRYIDPELAPWLTDAPNAGLDHLGLTRRERDVVRGVSTGLSNKEIARELSVSLSTVKFHLAHAFRKTGTESRAQLALHVASVLENEHAPLRQDGAR